MTAFDADIRHLGHWFRNDLLPLWAAQGYDRINGGFYETLDFKGKPVLNQPRRVRVQARQIYSFSEAGRRGWLAEGEAIAAAGFEHFLRRACPEDGTRGCVHLLSDNGETLDARRDLYDQAFLLLACAGRWRAAKDPRAIDLAEKTIVFLTRELASPHGGWEESDRGETPRRQNPHMHLFEAFLALHAATGESGYLEKANAVFALFEKRFFDASSDTLIEFFDETLRPYDNNRIIEPGHMFEWAWLLRSFDRAAGADTEPIRARLFQRAVALGEDDEYFGFATNRALIGGGALEKSKRLWPQAEYLKACFVRAGDGEPDALARAARLIDSLFQSYLNVEKDGLWIDEFDGAGAPIAKDVPASIVYHLLEAVIETERFQRAKDAS